MNKQEAIQRWGRDAEARAYQNTINQLLVICS